MLRWPCLLALLYGAVVGVDRPAEAEEPRPILAFEIQDDLARPLPCRIHLTDAAGKAQAAPGQPFWRDHFVCSGRVAIPLPSGNYKYEIERGPEHQRLVGRVELRAGHDHTVAASLVRFADLARDGWY